MKFARGSGQEFEVVADVVDRPCVPMEKIEMIENELGLLRNFKSYLILKYPNPFFI